MKNKYKRWNMSLFNEDRLSNILPKDGTVNFYGKILTSKEANQYFDLLMQNILWENDEVIILGKHIVTKTIGPTAISKLEKIIIIWTARSQH
jgi:hypothetical protein